MQTPRHPIQPLFEDQHGRTRFKSNTIVQHLLDWATERGMGLNELARMPFSDEDRQQFAQLIGYSLDGYGELSGYVDDDAYNAAANMAQGMSEEQARIAALQEELDAVRAALREPMARLFGLHPDSLLSASKLDAR